MELLIKEKQQAMEVNFLMVRDYSAHARSFHAWTVFHQGLRDPTGTRDRCLPTAGPISVERVSAFEEPRPAPVSHPVP